MNVCEAYSRDMYEHITRVPLFISARISLDTEAANPFIFFFLQPESVYNRDREGGRSCASMTLAYIHACEYVFINNKQTKTETNVGHSIVQMGV